MNGVTTSWTHGIYRQGEIDNKRECYYHKKYNVSFGSFLLVYYKEKNNLSRTNSPFQSVQGGGKQMACDSLSLFCNTNQIPNGNIQIFSKTLVSYWLNF